MTERDEQGKVVAIKLNPVAGKQDIDYELIVEGNPNTMPREVGPVFGERTTDSAKGHLKPVKEVDPGVEWFRQHGGI